MHDIAISFNLLTCLVSHPFSLHVNVLSKRFLRRSFSSLCMTLQSVSKQLESWPWACFSDVRSLSRIQLLRLDFCYYSIQWNPSIAIADSLYSGVAVKRGSTVPQFYVFERLGVDLESSCMQRSMHACRVANIRETHCDYMYACLLDSVFHDIYNYCLPRLNSNFTRACNSGFVGDGFTCDSI